MPVPIIAVTGTKGKTTTIAVIADVLRELDNNVLKVDTTGHFVNGERRSTLEDAKETWRLVPTVCPGRYLWEFHAHPELRENGVAVLEAALGSSALSGMGYRYHEVGVFLNVFEDHIGSSSRIQSKDDIVKAKSFIFKRIAEGGYAVFNADDSYVVGALGNLPEDEGAVTKVACGLTFEAYDLDKHLSDGGVAVTLNEKSEVVVRTGEEEFVVADLRRIPWTFNGQFTPSVWNILSAVGALYGYFGGHFPDGFRDALEAVRLDPYGGRLTLLESENGVTILADYAHEKVSLGLVGQLARTQAVNDGSVIGVVRLAHDRTDELIRETGRVIAPAYDQFIVYDKIDGHFRQAKKKSGTFPEVAGRTSDIFAAAIREVNPRVERVVREDEAIARAAEIARPGDVVVVIVNDNIERSIGFITDAFKARFK